jgi:hypothetical protein
MLLCSGEESHSAIKSKPIDIGCHYRDGYLHSAGGAGRGLQQSQDAQEEGAGTHCDKGNNSDDNNNNNNIGNHNGQKLPH